MFYSVSLLDVRHPTIRVYDCIRRGERTLCKIDRFEVFKKGGTLVVDDVTWQRWAQAIQFISGLGWILGLNDGVTALGLMPRFSPSGQGSGAR
jgi:hypothetical protein